MQVIVIGQMGLEMRNSYIVTIIDQSKHPCLLCFLCEVYFCSSTYSGIFETD